LFHHFIERYAVVQLDKFLLVWYFSIRLLVSHTDRAGRSSREVIDKQLIIIYNIKTFFEVLEVLTVEINKSAEKRARQSQERRIRNRAAKSRIKSAAKVFSARLAENNQEAAREELKHVVSLLDRYAGKGILHKNTAARKKSRLNAQLNKLDQQKEAQA